jgi:hypothetical protein
MELIMSRQISEKPGKNGQIATYVIAYFLLFIIVLLAVVLLFRVRMNVVQIAYLTGKNSVQVKGISNLVVLFTGVLLLVGIVVSEDYMRKGVELGKMWIRALRVFIVEAVLLIISFSLYYIIMRIVI